MTVLEQNSSQSQGRQPAASFGELTSQLSQQVSRLVRDEMALAQVEAKQRAKRLGAGVGMFGVAGGLAFFGSCCLVVALVIGLSNVMRPWLAAIVAAGALFFTALIVVLPGWRGVMERRPDVPHDTVESVKADVAAVKEAIKR
jgi:uncharacterized membrane protein YqjE